MLSMSIFLDFQSILQWPLSLDIHLILQWLPCNSSWFYHGSLGFLFDFIMTPPLEIPANFNMNYKKIPTFFHIGPFKS